MDRKTASYHTANPHGKHNSLESHGVEFLDMVGSKSQCGGQALWAGPEGVLLDCSATRSGPALGMFCELSKFSRGCGLSWGHPHCLKALLGGERAKEDVAWIPVLLSINTGARDLASQSMLLVQLNC